MLQSRRVLLWNHLSKGKFRSILRRDKCAAVCTAGASERLAEIRKERIKRLEQLAEKVSESVAAAGDKASSVIFRSQKKFIEIWPLIRDALNMENSGSQNPVPEMAVSEAVLSIKNHGNYIRGVQSVRQDVKTEITRWLEQIVSSRVACLENVL